MYGYDVLNAARSSCVMNDTHSLSRILVMNAPKSHNISTSTISRTTDGKKLGNVTNVLNYCTFEFGLIRGGYQIYFDVSIAPINVPTERITFLNYLLIILSLVISGFSFTLLRLTKLERAF